MGETRANGDQHLLMEGLRDWKKPRCRRAPGEDEGRRRRKKKAGERGRKKSEKDSRVG
jgi:hypothetical protein